MNTTDEELIELVEQKSPEELTLDEIQLLHRRLNESAALRTALYDQLQFEQYLADALGRANISADAIVDHVEGQGRARRQRLAWLGLGTCLLVGIGLWYQAREQNPAPNAAAAPTTNQQTEPDAPGEESNAGTDDPVAKIPAEGVRGDDDDDDTGQPGPKHVPQPKPPIPEANPELAPWQRADQLGGPQMDVAMLGVASAPERLNLEQAKRWLTPVPKHASKLWTSGKPLRVEVDGLHRLAAPWPADAVLRVDATFVQGRDLNLYFWSGTEGVLLQFPVFAYAISRDGDQPLPKSIELAVSDYGHPHWTNRSTEKIDIRYQDGELVFSRGGIRYMSAPLSNPPTDVFFQGKCSIDHIRMVRTTAFPPEPTKRPTLISDIKRPADLDWKTNDDSKDAIERRDDGSVRLVSKVKNKAVHAWFELKFDEKAPIREWLFELPDVTAGTSVYVGNASGGRMQEVRVLRDQKTKNNHLTGIQSDSVIERAPERNGRGAAWVGDHIWLRVLAVGKWYQAYVSRDGTHWATFAQGVRLEPIVNLGISASYPQELEERAITVRKIEVRGYQAINSIADPKLVAAANEHHKKLVAASSDDQWQKTTRETLPEKVALQQWQTACAVVRIAHGAQPGADVSHLLQAGVGVQLDRDAKLQLFDEVALISTNAWARHREIVLKSFTEQFAKLAEREMDDGNMRPFAAIGERALRLPLGPQGQPIVLTNAATFQIVAAVVEGKWDEAGRLAARLKTLRHKELDALVDWATAVGQKRLPGLKHTLRHPLEINLGKAEFNILAELEAAIDGEEFDDACRMMTSTRFSDLKLVVPTPEDEQLWVSFATLIERTADKHPELLKIMREKFGDRGLLRVRGAIADGDAAVATDVTLQFYGTAAAAEANAWLGDRALASGDFLQALRHYEQARTSAAEEMLPGLAARQRFAWSMLGQPFGKPISKPVKLGDVELTPKQFEDLVAEMLKYRRRDGTELVSRRSEATKPNLPKPTSFKVKSRQRIAMPGGARTPGIASKAKQQGVDWWSRRSSMVAAGDLLYLQTPWSVIAINGSNGQKLWQTDLKDHPQALEDQWPLLPTPPLVTEKHIFLRGFGRQQPEVVGLSRADGKVMWRSSGVTIISNPAVVAGKLVALTSETQHGNEQIYVASFDPTSGQHQGLKPLISLQSSWHAYRGCGLTVDGKNLLAALGGAVISFDTEGNIHWQRQQTWLPPTLNTHWTRQHSAAPLVTTIDGRAMAVIAQPGVPSFECVDPRTGSRIWRRVDVGACAVIGNVGSSFVVQTNRGLAALDAADGHTLWSRQAEDTTFASLCGIDRLMVVEQRPTADMKKLQTEIVWLSPTSGKVQAQGTTELSWDNRESIFTGPTLWHKNALFLAAGNASDYRSRELIQLIPSGKPASKPQRVATILRN